MSLSAALEQDIDFARRMLEEGADTNEEDAMGSRAIYLAVMGKSLPAVQLLLEYGADVTIKNRVSKDTALHIATIYGDDYNLHKLLLESGADCNDRNSGGTTPFLYVLEDSDIRIVQLLVDYGADIRAVDKDGWTALHYAARNPRVDVLQFVLRQGLNIECGNRNDYSPLHFAAAHGNPEGCELLLRSGAKVDRKSRLTGQSALSFLLLKAPGAGLHIALTQPSLAKSTARVVRLLLRYGARVADRVDSRTILEISAEIYINDYVRNALIEHMARMSFLNLKISEYDRGTIESKAYFKRYHQSCLREIESMKPIKFHNRVSVLNIFLRNDKLISRYVRNEDLVKTFDQKDYDKKFPIYFVWLREEFYAEVDMQRKRNSAAKILGDVFSLNDASHLIIQKILSFLGDGSLKFFVDM